MAGAVNPFAAIGDAILSESTLGGFVVTLTRVTNDYTARTDTVRSTTTQVARGRGRWGKSASPVLAAFGGSEVGTAFKRPLLLSATFTPPIVPRPGDAVQLGAGGVRHVLTAVSAVAETDAGAALWRCEVG